MAITNYTDLQAAVAARINRIDQTANIPTFIDAGLQRCNLDLQAIGGITDQETIATPISTVAGTDNYTYATDLLDIRYVDLTGGTASLQSTTLRWVSFDKLLDRWADTSGTPQDYALFTGKFYLRPIPEQAYTLNYGYVKKYVALSAGSDTNFLITGGTNVLLWAACMEASIQINDDQNMQQFASLYQKSMDLVIKGDKRKKRGPKSTLTVDRTLLRRGAAWNILTDQ